MLKDVELSVRPNQELHPARQVRLRCLDEQMLVVGHQDKGMQAPAVLIHGPRKPVEPLFAIPIVPDDIGAGIAPRHDMGDRTGVFDPKRPRHPRRRPSLTRRVKY